MAGWFGKKKRDAGNFRVDDGFDAGFDVGMEDLPVDALDADVLELDAFGADSGERMEEGVLPVLELGRMEVLEDENRGGMSADAVAEGDFADGAVMGGESADGAEGAVMGGKYADGAEGAVMGGEYADFAEGAVMGGESVDGAEGAMTGGSDADGAAGEMADETVAEGAGEGKVSADGSGTAAEAVKRKETESVGNVVLDYRHYPGEDFYCDGEVEDELLEIVKKYSAVEYQRIIEERASWPILYHLSPLRENIVDWIPMEKSMKVLEIGSGCGAITGKLAQKAGCDLYRAFQKEEPD